MAGTPLLISDVDKRWIAAVESIAPDVSVVVAYDDRGNVMVERTLALWWRDALAQYGATEDDE